MMHYNYCSVIAALLHLLNSIFASLIIFPSNGQNIKVKETFRVTVLAKHKPEVIGCTYKYAAKHIPKAPNWEVITKGNDDARICRCLRCLIVNISNTRVSRVTNTMKPKISPRLMP